MRTMFKPKGIDVDAADGHVSRENTMSEAEKKKMTLLKDTTLPMAMGYVTPDIVQTVLSGNGALPPSSSPQAAAFQDLAKRLESAGVARPIRRVVQSVSTQPQDESSGNRRERKRSATSRSQSTRRKSRADFSAGEDDEEEDDDDDNNNDDDDDIAFEEDDDEEEEIERPRRTKRTPSRTMRLTQRSKRRTTNSTKRSKPGAHVDNDDEEEYITNDSPGEDGDDVSDEERVNKPTVKRNLFEDEERKGRGRDDDDDDGDEEDDERGDDDDGDEEYVPPPRARNSGKKRVVRRTAPPSNQRGNRAPNGKMRNNRGDDDDSGEPGWRRYCCCCSGRWLLSLLYALLVCLLVVTIVCVLVFGVSHAICKVSGEESVVCFGWASPNSVLYGRSIYLSPIDGIASVTGTIWRMVPSVSFSKSPIMSDGGGGDVSTKSSSIASSVVAAGGVAATGKFLDPLLKNRFEAMVSAYKVPAIRDAIGKRSAANAQCLASLEDNPLFVLMQFIMAHRVCDFVDERSLAENVATFFGPLDSLGSAHAAEFVRHISQYPMNNN